MGSELLRLRPVSAATSTPDAGAFATQTVPVHINGMTTGIGIAVDGSQNVFISDSSKHVIYKYRFGATASRIFAGSYGVSGNADGQGATALFNQPGPICVDRRGNVWVADVGNKLVRKIDDNGRVFTVAALPTEVTVGGIAVDAGENIFLIDNAA